MRAKSTHCRHGHLLDSANVRYDKNGKYIKRICRECARRHALRHYYLKTHNTDVGFDYTPRTPIAEKFAGAYVIDPVSGCWMWMRARRPKGYGNFQFNGRTVAAHRYSWAMHRGNIPHGMHILHRCDNPPCVNPDHLFLGTNADNVADKIKKGRDRPLRGEENGRSKLSAVDVNFIRASELSNRELAALFRVDAGSIWRARTGRTWRHELTIKEME